MRLASLISSWLSRFHATIRSRRSVFVRVHVLSVKLADVTVIEIIVQREVHLAEILKQPNRRIRYNNIRIWAGAKNLRPQC